MAHLSCVEHDRRVVVEADRPTRHRADWSVCTSRKLRIGGVVYTPGEVDQPDWREPEPVSAAR